MCILKAAVIVLFFTHQGPRKIQWEKNQQGEGPEKPPL